MKNAAFNVGDVVCYAHICYSSTATAKGKIDSETKFYGKILQITKEEINIFEELGWMYEVQFSEDWTQKFRETQLSRF